ncbi:deoxyribodipyrimidine photo-lyase [Acinetobacter sp. ESL0695]|uniref:deoxyribodipyrimidine photo-lyase n=1 Tax=Acinetobacter sp. ESL0695 TaxID=2983215 RepID=UPI0023F509A3|nr:deoxyribodipyrimidine photo-lyase [Acinetobacter sp. ESL0695]WEV49563.1 deoxyribodipyrimidine photo-lyase [Acinetobacter sp. ESL0695]
MARNLFWFRQDLRLEDNVGLWHATQHNEECVALVIISPEQWKHHHDAPSKIFFYLRQLQEIQEDLKHLNIPLIIKTIQSWSNVPEYITSLCKKLEIEDIYANVELATNEKRRDDQVKEALSKYKKNIHLFEDRTLFPTQSIRNKSGEAYKVFTAFKKTCYERLSISIPRAYPSPSKQKSIVIKDIENESLNDLISQFEYDTSSSAFKIEVGEKTAQDKLKDFVKSKMNNYDQTRDIPNIDGTSQLSPYLNIGIISVRQCLEEVLKDNDYIFSIQSKGQQTWIDELLWREFYQHVMVDFPHICKHLPFKKETQKIQWRNSEEDLKKWQTGQTGIPIVDAGMRQLQQTGWMHNRVRMICAMFLSKNLLIDWRLGEKWFMQHLLDGDLAANNGGWQWSASTGTDAVPYFRIFNPVTQSQRFDPQGEYIRTWVPELKQLDHKQIHAPKEHIENYPRPIVDLKSSRARALAAFKNI